MADQTRPTPDMGSEYHHRGIRHARELEGHVTWLDSFSGTALGVLAVASGIYT